VKAFGFAPVKGRVIDYDKNDKLIYSYVVERDPSYALCIACGGCAATCSAAKFTPFSLRKINILVRRGENSEVRSEIDRCMLCGKCTLVCPRGVNTRNAIFLIREAFQKYDNYAV
jgi:heterodisulfide reductase subunit C